MLPYDPNVPVPSAVEPEVADLIALLALSPAPTALLVNVLDAAVLAVSLGAGVADAVVTGVAPVD